MEISKNEYNILTSLISEKPIKLTFSAGKDTFNKLIVKKNSTDIIPEEMEMEEEVRYTIEAIVYCIKRDKDKLVVEANYGEYSLNNLYDTQLNSKEEYKHLNYDVMVAFSKLRDDSIVSCNIFDTGDNIDKDDDHINVHADCKITSMFDDGVHLDLVSNTGDIYTGYKNLFIDE